MTMFKGNGGGGGGPVWRGNEPAGMTLVSNQPFTTLPSNGWAGFSTYGLVADATAPQSPTSVFEVIYPAGFTSGFVPGLAEINFVGAPYRTLYCCMYMKFSSNFQGEHTNTNKIIHFLAGASSKNFLFLSGHGAGANPLYAGFQLQVIVAGGNSVIDGGTAGSYTSGIELTRGAWHLLEVVTVTNTGSNLDGTVDLYVDGVLAVSCSGIEFETGSPLWNYVQESPTWGGGGDTVTSDMSIRVDHIYLSGK